MARTAERLQEWIWETGLNSSYRCGSCGLDGTVETCWMALEGLSWAFWRRRGLEVVENECVVEILLSVLVRSKS